MRNRYVFMALGTVSFSTFCWLLCFFFSSPITHTTGLSSARPGSCPREPTPSLLIPPTSPAPRLLGTLCLSHLPEEWTGMWAPVTAQRELEGRTREVPELSVPSLAR